MKNLDIDWQAFLQISELYLKLPPGARRFLVERVQPSQAVPNAVLGEWREVLLNSGLMHAGVQRKNAQIDQRYHGFYRVLRSMGRSRVFEAQTRAVFQEYLREHLDGPETAAFSGSGHDYYYYRDDQEVQAVYSRVTSAAWVGSFLKAQGPNWEAPYQARGHMPYFTSGDVVKAAQLLIQKLALSGVPAPLTQLPYLCPGVRPDHLAAALRAGFRYLLFYGGLVGPGIEPAVGLWPGLVDRLTGSVPKPPEAVTITQEFHAPFLMEDMTTFLAASATQPFRIRMGDGGIFEADLKVLAEAMGTLPEWVESEFHAKPGDRIREARSFLKYCGWLTEPLFRVHGFHKQELTLHVSEEGSEWLALGATDRLKKILDAVRGTLKRPDTMFAVERVGFVPDSVNFGSGDRLRAVETALTAVYGEMREGEFVRLPEFLGFHRRKGNPFESSDRKNRYVGVIVDYRLIYDPSEEELEDAWEQVLHSFLRQRLVPLGGAALGKDQRGVTCFALTAAGRYLLGGVKDFHLGGDGPARIVVQPNFEVVFLTPAAKAESEIGRFAERKGRHLGTLFKITKQSILLAAATGLTAERATSTLRQYCGGQLPANVEHEIAGWFGQYRAVTIRPAVIIHCPDRDTADRVMAVAGKKVTRLTETALELQGEKLEQTLLKKLREMGIFTRP